MMSTIGTWTEREPQNRGDALVSDRGKVGDRDRPLMQNENTHVLKNGSDTMQN